jgi:ABC-type dipeptide/oligopeptide/nickel transport system ATPase component
MRWGYKISQSHQLQPLELDTKSHIHALIVGSSGSGKSYSLLYLMGNLLKEFSDTKIYFCDFKNSTDFNFLSGYSNYYTSDNCYQGILDYYDSFCKVRIAGTSSERHLLIFDEYPAFILYLNGKDKINKEKKSPVILNIMSEILMLGRSLNFGIWTVTQRADSTFFQNGARDNFMIVLALGRLSNEQKHMLFADEEIPNKIYHQGEGVLLADGYSLTEVVFPRIRNIVDWKKHIKLILMGRN